MEGSPRIAFSFFFFLQKKKKTTQDCDKSIFNRHRWATWPDGALGFQSSSIQPTSTLKSEQHVCETCVSELCVGRVSRHLSVWARGAAGGGGRCGRKKAKWKKIFTGHQCLMCTGVSVRSASCPRHARIPFRGCAGCHLGWHQSTHADSGRED